MTTKSDLLKRIADSGYNVGFGAKKHFATYDIVERAPGWIGFISLSIGVLALFIEVLAEKEISSALILLGISGIYISMYDEAKQKYEEKGVFLTNLFNKMKSLYFFVKSSEKVSFQEEADALDKMELEFNANSISKQVLFSDCYAHYKFFWQQQIEWIDEQKKFSFWRDKIPLPVTVFCFFIVISLIIFILSKFL